MSMLTSTLIRFLDRLIIAEKSFALTMVDGQPRFLSAHNAEAVIGGRTAGAVFDKSGVSLLSTLPLGVHLRKKFPQGIFIPADISRTGVNAIESLAYDQALICSCSLVRRSMTPFEENFLETDEWETARREAQREGCDGSIVLSVHTVEKPAEFSPLGFFAYLLEEAREEEDGQDLMLIHTEETGTLIFVLGEKSLSRVFSASTETATGWYGAEVAHEGETRCVRAALTVCGNTLTVTDEVRFESLAANPTGRGRLRVLLEEVLR